MIIARFTLIIKEVEPPVAQPTGGGYVLSSLMPLMREVEENLTDLLPDGWSAEISREE